MAHFLFQASPELSYGCLQTCKIMPNAAVIHACKEPCHRSIVGYAERSLAKDHPSYLSHEDGGDLYLNIIDPPVPLFQRATFTRALDFARKNAGRPIHIHCNQGHSRAPSLALIIMAKVLNVIPDDSYNAAHVALSQKDAGYLPGAGIAKFLSEHWNEIK